MRDPLELFMDTLSGYDNSSKWQDARFGKIKQISNTLVGDVGQTFIELLCKELNIPCEFPTDPKTGKRLKQNSWDIRLLEVTFELKTATEDVNGSFQFNHVRYHRQYEGLICLGVTPKDLFFSVWSKADVATGKAGTLVSMEKNANASYKLTKRPSDLQPISKFEHDIKEFTTSFTGSRNC